MVYRYILALAGLALFLAFLPRTLSGNIIPDGVAVPVETAVGIANQEQAVPVLSVGRPARIKIPAIHVDAVVEQVGVTSDGTMDVPKVPDDVAWFGEGPRPGENGTAVIAGHEGWKDGIPAVFDGLSSLHKGDQIYVEDDRGATLTFVVRESRTYDPNADTENVFSSNDGKAHLNLITCEGIWDASSKSYSKRLVVFTDKE
jgi:sortase A